MKLEKEVSYEAPEGSLQGTITIGTMNVDYKTGKPRENLRLTIAVDPIPGDPVHDYRVRVDYWGNQSNGLLPDLYRILGPEIVNLTDEEGEIISSRLSLLQGKRVRFDVTHEQKPGYETAFRKVSNLRPLQKPENQQQKAA